MKTKQCPYCGETIAAAAVKCRFCHEWLVNPNEVPQSGSVTMTEEKTDTKTDNVAVEQIELPKEQPITVTADDDCNADAAIVPQQSKSLQPNISIPPSTQQAVGQTNVMPQINVNVVQQNTQRQQTVIVEKKEEGTGCLNFQALAIGIGVWGATSWWVGLITYFVLLLLLLIPGIGHIMCVILGAAVGLVSGALSAGLGAPTSVSWIIGIVIGIGCVGINIEQRKKMLDEL